MRTTSTNYGRPHRPLPVAAFNRVGPRASLDPDSLVRDAVRRTHEHYLGDEPVRERLGRLVSALESEARLHRFGRVMVRENLVRILSNRLRMEALFDRVPRILDRVPDDPIVIVGLQRTGTTLLHRLLACDSELRVLESWEAINPAPLPRSVDHRERCTAEPGETSSRRRPRAADRRVASAVFAQRAVRYLAPDFFAIHPIDARSPEEECLLFDYAFLGTVPEATYRVPSFSRWLEEQDPTEGYRFLQRVLALLSWQRPGERWLLKTPQHLENLAALFAVFPRAQVVFTHRDPARSVPSFFSMIAHAWGVFSDEVRPREVADHWGRKHARMIARALAVRGGPKEEHFCDVHYRELTRDPIGAVERIYQWLGRTVSPTMRTRMGAYIARNPQHKHGRHSYRSESFGLSESDLLRDFGAYIERFRIEKEP